MSNDFHFSQSAPGGTPEPATAREAELLLALQEVKTCNSPLHPSVMAKVDAALAGHTPAAANAAGLSETCLLCDGEGVIHTGMEEYPTSQCNACSGTGQIALRAPASDAGGRDWEPLRRAAQAATPGPWVVDREAVRVPGDFDRICTMQVSNQPNWDHDAAFIAAANPATVLALLNRVAGLQASRAPATSAAALDAARLDFMIAEECQIEHLDLPGKAPLYRVRWPYLEQHQRDWQNSAREAIDAGMETVRAAAKGAARLNGGEV